MTYANDEECYEAGLDPYEVERVARNLSKWARKAHEMDLTVFGGSGPGSLRYDDRGYFDLEQNIGQLIVASLDGRFDGGDGAASTDEDGLLRGE